MNGVFTMLEKTMTEKEEAIRRTGYDEKGLITLALLLAQNQARGWRNNADDSESYDHYENLMIAFTKIYSEMMTDI